VASLAAGVLLGLSCQAPGQIIVWGAISTLTNIPPQATNVVSLAGGDEHCLALRRDGTVVAWGKNSAGQVTVPADLTNVVGIAAGSTHSLALRDDGTVALWGSFYFSGYRGVPDSVTNVVALALGPGAQHAVALRGDGTPVDWGNPSSSYTYTNYPVDAVDLVSVAAGAYDTIALRSDGRVVAWGTQTRAPANLTNIVAIATSWSGNAALRADGRVATWGIGANLATELPTFSGFTNVADLAYSPSSGVLGLRHNGSLVQYGGGTFPAYPTNEIAVIGAGSYGGQAAVGSGPPVFPGRVVNRTVTTGSRAYFHLKTVGELPLTYQWSCNGTNVPGATNSILTVTNVQPGLSGAIYTLTASNALGTTTSDGMTLNVLPAEVFFKATNSAVVVGATLTFSSQVIGQGPFSYRWLFNGTNWLSSTNATLSLTNVQISDAGMYSLIVSNSYGFATNSILLTVSPTIITKAPANQFSFPGGTATFSINLQVIIPNTFQWRFNGADIAGATSSVLSLTNLDYADAGTYTLVFGNAYEVVTNAATLVVSPVTGWGYNSQGQNNPPDGLTNLVAVAAGSSHSVVLDSGSRLTVWGGDASRRAVPADLTNAIAISAGNSGTVALRSDGTVTSWGSGGYASSPVPAEATNVVAVSAGSFHALALRSDGTVVGWGQNTSGQASPPVGLSNVVAVSAGSAFSLALKDDGRVVAWGYNGVGETNVPPSLSNVVAIAAGSLHAIALKDDGSVAVWGSGSGVNSLNIPPEATNIVAVAAGYGHCLVLKADGSTVAWGYYYNGETNIPPGLTNVAAISAADSHNLALVASGPPAMRVTLLNPVWNAAGFQVALPSRSGRVYRLEYTGALGIGDWQPLPLAAGNGSMLTLTDPAPNAVARFYRVRQR
jgi:alpha-tubulin suppressor-like RCC1 family protein